MLHPPGSETMARQLERKDSRELLEREASKLAGHPVTLKIRLEEEAAGPRTESPPPPGDPRRRGRSEAPAAPRRRAAVAHGRRSSVEGADREGLLRQATREPGVKKLLREFGAQVIDIRPLEAPRDLLPTEEGNGPAKESR